VSFPNDVKRQSWNTTAMNRLRDLAAQERHHALQSLGHLALRRAVRRCGQRDDQMVGMRRGPDTVHAQISEQVVAALAGQDYLERLGNLGRQLQRLAIGNARPGQTEVGPRVDTVLGTDLMTCGQEILAQRTFTFHQVLTVNHGRHGR
jgi:hypothetical protein